MNFEVWWCSFQFSPFTGTLFVAHPVVYQLKYNDIKQTECLMISFDPNTFGYTEFLCNYGSVCQVSNRQILKNKNKNILCSGGIKHWLITHDCTLKCEVNIVWLITRTQ